VSPLDKEAKQLSKEDRLLLSVGQSQLHPIIKLLNLLLAKKWNPHAIHAA